jgi:hypothetical protein
MADLKRKSIEPIALAAGVPVRTLQEFLAFFAWDEARASALLQQRVTDAHGSDRAIGVLDSCGHAKKGDKTPGVQRQWCGESGKVDNCVVGQHLLYTDNDPDNPFSCVLASDLYLPESWAQDRKRCGAAHIPDDVVYRAKWAIGLDQLAGAMRNGVRFAWVTFDEEYGRVPWFWFGLDALGQRAIGEVPKNFLCWPSRPHGQSFSAAHAARRVDNVCRHSPAFTGQAWRKLHIKDTTRGPMVWEVKAARVHLLDIQENAGAPGKPTDRQYWLIVACSSPSFLVIRYDTF